MTPTLDVVNEQTARAALAAEQLEHLCEEAEAFANHTGSGRAALLACGLRRKVVEARRLRDEARRAREAMLPVLRAAEVVGMDAAVFASSVRRALQRSAGTEGFVQEVTDAVREARPDATAEEIGRAVEMFVAGR